MNKLKAILLRCWLKIKAFMRGRNLFTFCLFLVFAAILWYGHAMNTVRERTLSIEIQYAGIPDNVAFTGSLPAEFRFTVRDQGKRLQKYHESTFIPIEIDLSQQLNTKEGHLHIAADQVKSKIADQLQGTAKIQNIQPDIIETDFYTQHSKSVAVKIEGDISAATQYYFTQPPVTIPSKVKIFGKKEQLDSITAVSTEVLSATDIRDSISINVGLMPVSGIRFATDSVTVKAQTRQFTEKRLTLNIPTKGVPAGERMRIFPSTAEVTVHIPVEYFNEVNENNITIFCKYPQKQQRSLPVELKYDSKHIIKARVTPAEVEYIIEKL